MAKHRSTTANGRSAPEQFMPLHYGMVQSDSWRSLSGPSVKILIEIYSRFNGRNNGQLCLSYADAAKKLHLAKATIRRAFDELQDKGFIRRTKKGFWYGRKAQEWLITNKNYQGYAATNDWKHWHPSNGIKIEVGSIMEHNYP